MDTASSIFSTLQSSVSGFHSLFSTLLAYAPLILEILILAFIRTPLFGLRVIPVYGDYFYFHSIVPHKKKISIIYAITKLFGTSITIAGFGLIIISIFASLGSSSDTGGNLMTAGFVLCIIGAILVIITLVLRIQLLMEASESFRYDRSFGILFGFFPLIGDICFLIAAKRGKYRNLGGEGAYENLYGNRDYQDNSQVISTTAILHCPNCGNVLEMSITGDCYFCRSCQKRFKAKLTE